MAKKGKRQVITLECPNCHNRNYNSMKNIVNDPEKLELRKWCRFCREHTTHKETKK